MSGVLMTSGHIWSVQNTNVIQVPQGDFWYDASAGSYFIPSNLANGATVTGWISKFTNGITMGTNGFGPTTGSKAYSLPNFYFVGNNTYTPTVANVSAYIAPGTASTFTGSVSTTSNPSIATLTVTSAPTNNGIVIGYVISGGTIPANTYVFAKISGSATSSSSVWTLNNSVGTSIPAQASQTLTVTPIVMTVTSVANGIVGTNNLVYTATTANITANTFITALGTGTGGTGTYYVSINQTKGTSGSPLAYSLVMPFVGFNSGDAFRIPMGSNLNVINGYTLLIAYRLGSVSGNVNICGSDNANGGEFLIGMSGNTYVYGSSGATATGNIKATTTGWHVHSLIYDGSQSTNATKLVARIDGVGSTLSFTGAVGNTTAAPSNLTITSTSVTANSPSTGQMTVGFATQGSAPFSVGQGIVLSGFTPNTTSTGSSINTAFTVTGCSNTSVQFSMTGTYTASVLGTVNGTPITNLFVAGKAPTVVSGTAVKNTNPVTATQGLNIGEMIAYESALPLSQVQTLEKYLKNKWLGTN